MLRRLLIAALAGLLAGCAANGGKPAAPTWFADSDPATLAPWGMVNAGDGRLTLGEGVVSYELTSPLFSDHAHKLRTVWMPAGTSAAYSPDDAFAFPVGTVITKTFFYPRSDASGSEKPALLRTDANIGQDPAGLDLTKVHLVETRVLVRRAEGWVALPYVWDEAGKSATLKPTGAILRLTLTSEDGAAQPLNYVVPDRNQCAGCHVTDQATKALQPIGPKARHLNRDHDYPDGRENQLTRWTKAGYLSGAPGAAEAPRNADWKDASLSLDTRARAWLDINCSHCHSPTGPADTSGLDLTPTAADGPRMGICKSPIAAGKGTGDRSFDIVPGKPDASILLYRIESTDPSVMMPEVGRTLADKEAAAMIRAWIGTMQGDCGT
jgi:uncharacterized repeat protein (TIGR03806 family)